MARAIRSSTSLPMSVSKVNSTMHLSSLKPATRFETLESPPPMGLNPSQPLSELVAERDQIRQMLPLSGVRLRTDPPQPINTTPTRQSAPRPRLVEGPTQAWSSRVGRSRSGGPLDIGLGDKYVPPDWQWRRRNRWRSSRRLARVPT